ncbi:glutaredoxin family protein [Shewanella gelidii]|uniref:Thioredoxin family protein n=1 Tax=Shewanella gelidii TaxID=1642821 RepID=A0A917JX49_9GAMM|nr:glutaredoxin family protein [Shewanella gelidii]MCL1099077.1 glutaredoxin family protein [Shewanella gelidii]GGI88354.1 thioredoxin family protein [Shewanella gelidii]
MGKQSRYVLLHTEGCHLCDEAMVILQQANVPFLCCDICEDEELATVYGTRIPVLRNDSNGLELNWPFDSAALHTFTGETLEFSSDQ